MASKREQVLEAVRALVQAALPQADVSRNKARPTRIGPGGAVIVRDGDPGEPTGVYLSPLTYTYAHQVPLDVAAYGTTSQTSAQALDALLMAIGAAVEADRTLGGLCEWVEPMAPAPEDAEVQGGESFRWAEVVVVCTYDVKNPLAD